MYRYFNILISQLKSKEVYLMGLNNLKQVKLPEVSKPKESKLTSYDWDTPLSTDDHYVSSYHDDGWVGFTNLDMILSEAIEADASDIHITPNMEVAFTIHRTIEKQPQYAIPDLRVMDDLVHAILSHEQYSEYAPARDYDFPYIIQRGPYKGRRFRGNVGRTFGADFLVFRTINEDIPSLKELKVPDELVKWSHLPNGLWMICGPTGTGKSTTLASIINDLQMHEHKRINTIEKPIEYTYPRNGNSLVVQREVGEDTNSFSNGIVASMRENPDIILIGEVRNNEEISQLINAAESGHLAISTMHTNAVATTLNRIQSLFDGSERRRILSTLSDTLRGLANQVLVKGLNGKMFAVREILSFNDETRKMVAEGDVHGIRDYQLRYNITMEDELVKLVIAGKVGLKEARAQAAFPDDFDRIYKQNS